MENTVFEIGNIIGNSCDEYLWNDSTGASGGGISDFFPLPSYQNGAGVPVSVNNSTHTGRGVPDVAANSSGNSGYSYTLGGNPFLNGGTSAAAPLWAGLIAVINAEIGENVGFINPLVYELKERVFRDIVSPPGPSSNSFAGTPGYPVTKGWDATTGWGTPKGKHLLHALKHFLKKECKVITHHHTFSKHEVATILGHSNPAIFHHALYVEVEGFRPGELGITAASLTGTPNVYPLITPDIPIPGMTIGNPVGVPSSLHAQDPALFPSPQRFTWVFPVTFSDTSGFTPGNHTVPVTASIAGVHGSAKIHLVDRGHHHPHPVGHHAAVEDHTGKVTGLVFDKFGDFSGFELETTKKGVKKFRGNEGQFASLVERAWKERVKVTVVTEKGEPEEPKEIIFRLSHP
jgi:kumamolisin